MSKCSLRKPLVSGIIEHFDGQFKASEFDQNWLCSKHKLKEAQVFIVDHYKKKFETLPIRVTFEIVSDGIKYVVYKRGVKG